MSEPDIKVTIGGDSDPLNKELGKIPKTAERELGKAEKVHQQHLNKRQKMIEAFEKKRDIRRKAYFEIDLRRAEVERMRIDGRKDEAAFGRIQIDYERDLLSISKKRYLTDRQRVRLRNSAFDTREAKVHREHTRIAKREGEKRIAEAKRRADQRVGIEKNTLDRMRRDQKRHDFMMKQERNRRGIGNRFGGGAGIGRFGAMGAAAGVAVVGVGAIKLVSSAMQEAAKDNAKLRREMDGLAASTRNLLATIGNEYARLEIQKKSARVVDGTTSAYSSFNNNLTDIIAYYGLGERGATGHAKRIDDAERADRNLTKLIPHQAMEVGIQRQLTIQGGGERGFEAQQAASKRSFMKMLNDVGFNTTDRDPLVRQFDQNQRNERQSRTNAKKKRFQEKELERLKKFNEERLKALAIERELLEIQLQRNPKNYTTARKIERIRLQEDKINETDPTLAAKRSAQRHRDIDWKERRDVLEKKRIAKTIQRQLFDDRMERMRLAGQSKRADKLDAIEQHERNILDIKKRQNITDEQRQALLDNEDLNLKANLGSLGRSKSSRSIPTIADGLGGSPQIFDRVYGVKFPSPPISMPENKTAENTERALPLLEQLVENTANLGRPVLGP